MADTRASSDERPLWVGAVAYDPKVVTIWEGMRRYFVEEAKLPVEVVLFQSYEAQVASLLAKPGEGPPCIDIAWNTNLAFIQAERWSAGACRPIAMRDADIGWMTKILAVRGGPVRTLADLRGRTLALGSRDSGHAAILPLYFLAREGLRVETDFSALRFNSDIGKHGDTGRSETEVVRALLDGRADAGAVGSPYWQTVQSEGLVPKDSLVEIWTSPPFNHCMFTARADLDPAMARRFAEALSGMDFDNADHRPILEAEGLRQWVPPQLAGYTSLREACDAQGLLTRRPC
jgi:ABC-type phosphate/phosphonate transport system substrate-binding protein